MLGLKRGAVRLYDHEEEWETQAQRTIVSLREIFGDTACDIQHVGSTAIKLIKAKPIIDIAVAVKNLEDALRYESELKNAGFYYRPDAQAALRGQLLFACGSYYEGTGDLQTHFIHVVEADGIDWLNYINFRNYLNKKPSVANAYEQLKLSLAQAAPIDSGREKYLAGKHDFIINTLRKALVDSYLGKIVTIKIDRPLGSVHPKYPDTVYPVNYGYIPGICTGDGEELDAYILGVDSPLEAFTGRIIAVIHRENDVEDKFVASPDGTAFTENEIAQTVYFQEQYYKTRIEIIIP